MDQKYLLSPRDVWREYGIPCSTQSKKRMQRGAFAPHVKRGRSVYYFRADIEQWLASLKRTSTLDNHNVA
jgi:hypothetical protein